MTAVELSLKILGWIALALLVALAIIVILPFAFWYGIWKGICA